MLLGALEAGGTKMICSLGDETGKIFSRERFETRAPADTMPKLLAYFASQPIRALGIGSFGPLDLDPASAAYGAITNSPKKEWVGYPLLTAFRKALAVPVALDTDVNAAALAEYRLGAGRGANSCVYFTIGTGIGGGLCIDGRLIHGLTHPEMGHMPLKPHADDPSPEGFCPFHRGCAEGLASGTAMRARWGMPAQELPSGHIAWLLEAFYLAQMCVCVSAVCSPGRIILGGGVMQRDGLIEQVREEMLTQMGGYWPVLAQEIARRVTLPALGQDSGAAGALLLAVDALKAV